MKRILNLFTHHPHSVNESYSEHMSNAFYYGFKMIISGFAALIHAVFPFVFKTTASTSAREIIEDVDKRAGSDVNKDQFLDLINSK
jgi:hypothetical protein|tara:strand:- start:1698 stop:1955 length:258 start_codon:yes stop_codon:yes gene_type:complete